MTTTHAAPHDRVHLSEETVSRIISAYAQRTDTSINEIVDLAQRLSTFVSLGTAEPDVDPGKARRPANIPTAPALPIEDAATDGLVYCLCCGVGFKTLKRHLMSSHGLDEASYRAAFGLGKDYPLVSRAYSEKRARLAVTSGLGKHARR